MREMGMTDAGSRVILRSGLNTYGKLAFAHGQPGVALDEAAFNLFAQATLGAMANLGDTAVLKRLLFESHTLVLAQLKQQVTDPDGSSSRKMPPVEREARMENLKLRLPGVVIQRQMEPSHSLLDLCIQQWETRQLKFLSPEKCTSRQWEIEMSKGSKQIELDSDKLLVKEKSDVPDCVAHTELQTFEALRRRGIALAFADVVSWESHEAYLMALFANLQKSPPQNYVKPTLQQVLRADRAVFTKLIQDETPVRRAADGTLPLDTALIAALNHPDAAYHLMPLPSLHQLHQKLIHQRMSLGITTSGIIIDTAHGNAHRFIRGKEKAKEKESPVTGTMCCQKPCKEGTMCQLISIIVGSVLHSSSIVVTKQRMEHNVQMVGICAPAGGAMPHILTKSMMHPRERMQRSDGAGWAALVAAH